MKFKKPKIGDVEPTTDEKGNWGKSWMVYLGKESWFDCDTQYKAEILGHLAMINDKLRRLLKKGKKE